MNEARPYASLSSGLLARKGSAKPAMRPQGFTGFEDLGWNDMGHDRHPEFEPAPEHVPSSIAALTPAPRALRAVPVEEHEPRFDETPETPAEPPQDVVAQQEAIAKRFDREEEESAPAPVRRPAAKVVPLPSRSTAAGGRKAAFTLRLDSDRHIRLRLACAILGRSAQQFVAGALDEALAAIPEIEALAAQVPASGAKRN